MYKKFFADLFEQKFLLMFITSVIYILGLVSFFNNCGIAIFGILVLLFIFFLLKEYISPKLVLFWVLIYFFGFFNPFFRIKNSDDLRSYAPTDAIIRGQVVTIPDLGMERQTRFFFKVNEIGINGERKKVSGKTFVSVDGKQENITVGEFYVLEGKLRVPFAVTNPSQFDYAKYLRNYDVFTTFYASNYEEIREEASFKWRFLQGLNQKRKEILGYHARNIKSPNLEILGGVVFGDDAVTPPDYIKTSFINSGILHILAASGMNVALIYGIFFFIFQKLRIPITISNLFGIFIVILYTFMTGMGASVVRASVILIFILVGKLMNRDAHSLSLLSLVAFLMLIFNPAYIKDVGFQLSFVVTFGLLIMASPIFEKIKVLPKWLVSAIFIPIIAQLWVAPIQIFYFNSFYIYSILANILILPLITIISFGGFISSVLSMVKPIASYICIVFDFILNPVLSLLVSISDFFSSFSNSILTMAKPSVIQMFLYYIFLVVLTYVLTKGIKKKYIISLLVLIILFCVSLIKPRGESEIIFFDVQNADCFLYKTSLNKYFIIDTGKSGFKNSKSQVNYILMEYLKDEGIRDIEGLIITHFDSDHAGGAEDLIKNLQIKNVYVNSFEDESEIAQKLYKSNIHLMKVKNNDVIYEEEGLEIKTFYADIKGKEGENENSIITLINDRGYKILLMADAGLEAYKKLDSEIPKNVDVLKIGHHGAKDVINNEMLEKLSPEYLIISTGTNHYGHPNKGILSLLPSTKVLRTDIFNAIKIKNKKAYRYVQDIGWLIVR